MKKSFNIIMLAASLTAAFSASAVTKDIIVTADVDQLVNITKADGSVLPNNIAMEYLPGPNQLAPHTEQVRIWSNAVGKDIEVKLTHAANLSNISGAGSIPLTVKLDGKMLATTATTFGYAELFPSGIETGSRTLGLTISQTASEVITTGNYSGVVGLVVSQATTTL